LEKSAAVDSAEPISKEILQRLRQHFVEASIFSTRGFCQRENFVGARFLLTREFCQHEIFVGLRILSMRVLEVEEGR
jgi:hypothetical protein